MPYGEKKRKEKKNQRTLVIIKPDAVKRKLTGEIIRRLEANGVRIAAMRTERLTAKKCRKLYAHVKQKNKDLFGAIVRYMTSMPVFVILLDGENAAIKVKQLCGATDPALAKRGTIRGDFGIDAKEVADREGRPVYNLIHAADPENAEKEISLFFG